MAEERDIENRRHIWVALSDLYIDNELQPFEIQSIAKVFKASSFTLDEIHDINRQDVFPVLKHNLLTVAGIWTGFEEEELIKAIVNHKSSLLSKFLDKIMFWKMKKMFAKDWSRINSALDELAISNM